MGPQLLQKNPLLHLGHNYQKFPVGVARNVRVDNRQLRARFRFHSITEEAKQAWELTRQKILRGFSVGFLSLASQPGEKDSGVEKVHTKAKLLEVSLTSLPANENALALAYQRGLCGHRVVDALHALPLEARAVSLEDFVTVLNALGETVTKIEETTDWIHWPVRPKSDFDPNTFKTWWISEKEKIKCVGGRLRDAPPGQEGSMIAQKFLFSKKAGWTKEKARRWIEEHGKAYEESLLKGEILFLENAETLRGLAEDLAAEVDRRIEKRLNKARGLIEFPTE